MISFELTKEQKSVKQKIRRLAEERLRPSSFRVDAGKPGPLDNEYRRIISEEHLNAFIVPVEFGGREVDHVTLSVITEEIGYGCAGMASIYGATIHATSPLLIGGSQEQKEAFLPMLLKPGGEVAGCCITEEKGGSDTSFFTTTARQVDGGYIITGTKVPVLNAGSAAFYVVWASSNAGRGRAGINAFLIPKDTPGITFGPYHDKHGLRCAPTAAVHFNEVMVPRVNLVGLPGSGYLLLMQCLDWGRAFFGAVCVGLARAAIEESIKFAKDRNILDRPIIKNQSISFILAELATEIDAARLLIWRACRLMDLKMDFSRESSMAKLFASEVAAKTTNEGMLILGKKGYLEPSPMSKYQRDAQGLRIIEGTSQIQKRIISGQL
jgi:acyl-CoA dehydrogenase